MTEITKATIVQCVREISKKNDIGEDTDIFTAGFDSLAVLRCRALLKAQTGVKVPGHVFFGGRTPAGIAELIGGHHVGR